jgi:citrate synthase
MLVTDFDTCQRGFDTEMFIAIVGLSRLPGALAHWRETLGESNAFWSFGIRAPLLIQR